MRTPLSLVLATALAGLSLAQDDDPDAYVEPGCANHRWSWDDEPNLGETAIASPLPENGFRWRPAVVDIKPGDINCRRWDQTPSNVGYWTCNDLATTNDITLDKFWELNPGLSPDCEGIKPGALYCVRGCKFRLFPLPVTSLVCAAKLEDLDVLTPLDPANSHRTAQGL